MREFEKRELECIRKMSEGATFIADLFDLNRFPGLIMKYYKDSITGIFKIEVKFREPEGNSMDKYQELLIEVAQVVNLVSYLQKNNYVFFIIPSHGDTVQATVASVEELKHYNKHQNDYNTNISFTDKVVEAMALSATNKMILPTKALKEYVKNGFKTKADLQNERSNIIGVVGIVIAIALGLIGILMQISSSSCCCH